MEGFTKLALAAAVTLAMAGAAYAADMKVTLAGDQEVPPVTTQAKGTGTVVIGDDGAVSGVVTTSGIAGTAAHIHMSTLLGDRVNSNCGVQRQPLPSCHKPASTENCVAAKMSLQHTYAA